jgi:excisionase family DNA binding protein
MKAIINQTHDPASATSLFETSQLLTVEEVMRLLKLGRTKIYHLMNEGRLESVKIGSARRIKLASALALIETSREQPNKA